MNLGTRLHALRKSLNYSLRDLAERSQCSASFLSQIELNQTSPSVNSLERICNAMGIDLQEFFSMRKKQVEKVVVHHGAQRQRVSEWDEATLEYFLPSNVIHSMSVLLLSLKPWGKTKLRAAHRSMKELCIVLRGEVGIYIGEEEEKLRTGDAIYLDLINPHKWTNLTDEDAEVLLINPNFTEVFNLGQSFGKSEETTNEILL